MPLAEFLDFLHAIANLMVRSAINQVKKVFMIMSTIIVIFAEQ